MDIKFFVVDLLICFGFVIFGEITDDIPYGAIPNGVLSLVYFVRWHTDV